MLALEHRKGLAAVDEVQRAPDLFKVLRDSGLLLLKDGRRVGIECKRTDAPRLMPSMTTAMKDLGLEALYVVYPGSRRYPLGTDIEAVPLPVLAE
jgi:predicted AAA+ superfamily ATPase